MRKRYRLACPIHRSANPTTFSVLDDEYWYCFVCAKGGTAVELLSELEGIPRSQALDRLGVDQGAWALRQSAWNLNQQIAGIEQSKPKEVLPPVGLGAPPFPVRELHWPTIKFWALQRSEDGVYFPFRDIEGRLIGWSIRQSSKRPKYLISPGFRKTGFLYGLYENQAQIRAQREVIVVEGQFDALAVWDAGFPAVVATLGCNLAKDQARLLLPWIDRIRVLYDGDKAGRQGAEELKCRWKGVFDIELLYLADGEDPASIGARLVAKVLADG